MKVRLIGLSVALLLVLASSWWFMRPRLELYSGRSMIIVDVQRLGEYNSVLSSLELRECGSERPVWRLESSNDVLALWAFPLRRGINPALPRESLQGKISEERLTGSDFKPVELSRTSGYKVVIPSNSSNFELISGTCYRLTVEPSGTLRRFFRVSESFVLQ